MGKGTAKEIEICGKTIRLGDKLKVKYTTGDRFLGTTIEGEVVELWDGETNSQLQGRLSNNWCFHDCDEILTHEEK